MADKANGVQRYFCGVYGMVADGPEYPAREGDVFWIAESDYEQLQAKLEAAERDAARWRWLRPQAHFHPRLAFHGEQGWEMQIEIKSHHASFGEAIDAAIDAQRQEGK